MTNNTDKAMREAFEAWATARQYNIRTFEGNYYVSSTCAAWAAWQAALASSAPLSEPTAEGVTTPEYLRGKLAAEFFIGYRKGDPLSLLVDDLISNALAALSSPASSAGMDAQRRDAERYRWLRDKAGGEIVFDHTKDQREGGNHFVLHIPFDGRDIPNDAASAATMAEAIDAAIASKEQP